MNRTAFYAHLRRRDSGAFGTSLSQRQVDATEALLDAGRGLPIDHLAHVLGEVYHETGGGMYPVKETVMPWHTDKNPSDATVIARLDRAHAKGRLPKRYWRDGWFGRGQIQLTHLSNYEKMGILLKENLTGNPDLALDPAISARIAVEGCRHGVFTGMDLSDFNGPEYDHYNARAIVNGDKRANGNKVAGYARAFTAALREAGYTATETATDAPPDPPATEAPEQTGWLRAVLLRLLGLGK